MKILIIDQLHDSIHDLLAENNLTADYRPAISKEEVIDILHQYDGVMVRSKMRFTKEVLETAPNLQFIARSGAGMDNIDEAYAKAKGIHLINAPEGNRDAVGEHTLGMLLSLMNKLNTADTEVRANQWDREGNRGHEVMGKTVGIIGYGNMGRAFAQRLLGFNCKVLAYDKYKSDFSDQYAQEVSLETLFEETDILSIHTPLTEETRGWLDTAFFNKFKKNLYFLNAARGEIVPFEALNDGLQSGKLIAAGLDVLEVEKFNQLTDPQRKALDLLQAQKNVLFTPHVGGWTFESYRRLNEVMVKKITDFLKK
ncbi:2-hydroxyacid dehydrogenase [Persicobacter psychrovividus]|uniref:2-hydroxyacid dehydrogenase n=1 Tax=Persicobacter psychrovividus TaxID=387638 RepID=A0ABN6L5Y3_9BACT|nr:2-hydroxyacid dehydrogenase [Persicobacter psychrovividus]